MRILRLLTAGESHGKALVGILEGLPAGLELTARYIDAQLSRRQKGHGRGARMRIERDAVTILAGVRHGKTLGSPLALLVPNADWRDYQAVYVPRPGHADYAGAVKYGHDDMRNVSERSSARETTMRVALGAVARRLLEEFQIHIASRVVEIGGQADAATQAAGMPIPELKARAEASPVRCLNPAAARRMMAAIDGARDRGDTVGGIFEVVIGGLPVGLGSYAQWDRRLEGDLARAFMSLNAVKGVEIGLGFKAAGLPGSTVHDELFWDRGRACGTRRSNRAGGIEGGLSNGQDIVIRAAMKPLSTLKLGLASINLQTRKPARSPAQRSDVCAVPAAAVIAEALAALELADAFLLKYGGDSIGEIRAHYES